MDTLNFIQSNYVAITLAFTLVAGVFKFWQYVDVRRSEQRQRRFENYHKLVERLTAPLPNHDDPYLDVQKAAIFEMRNYPEYKAVTRNIFEGWKDRHTKLTELMEDTLNVLK